MEPQVISSGECNCDYSRRAPERLQRAGWENGQANTSLGVESSCPKPEPSSHGTARRGL